MLHVHDALQKGDSVAVGDRYEISLCLLRKFNRSSMTMDVLSWTIQSKLKKKYVAYCIKYTQVIMNNDFV
jgi:hypothetical protein